MGGKDASILLLNRQDLEVGCREIQGEAGHKTQLTLHDVVSHSYPQVKKRRRRGGANHEIRWYWMTQENQDALVRPNGYPAGRE